MCVARGRLNPAVTEQPADDRQPLAERKRPRGEGVTYIVYWFAPPPTADQRRQDYEKSLCDNALAYILRL